MRFSTTLVLFATIVTTTFHTVTVSAIPHGSIESRADLTPSDTLEGPQTAGTDDLHISPQANLVKRLGAELKVPGTVKEIQAEIESLGEGEGAPAAGAHSHTKRLGLVMKVMPNVRKGSSQGNDGISAAEADLQRLAAKGAEEVKGKEEKKEGKAPSDEGGNKL